MQFCWAELSERIGRECIAPKWQSLILEKPLDDQALNSLAEGLPCFGPPRALTLRADEQVFK